MSVSEDVGRGVFLEVVSKETAVPCRRAVVVSAPKGGGDVVVKVVEGVRGIKVTRPEKPRTNGTKAAGSAGGEGSDEDDFSDSDSDDPPEIREKSWTVTTTLAGLAVRDVKKGGKVEVTINVAADLGVHVTAREVGGKGGVRGTVERRKENGSA